MRDELKAAIEALSAGLKPWYAKTYDEFWEWFNAEDARIGPMAADDAEREAVREALLDIRADTGRDLPDDWINDVVEQPPRADPTRADLDARIASLRAQIPTILAADEQCQMDAFAGIADEIPRRLVVLTASTCGRHSSASCGTQA